MVVLYNYGLCTGVHIGFEFSSYLIKEGEHGVEVCAVIKTGHIKDTAIQVNAFAMSETAKSMS